LAHTPQTEHISCMSSVHLHYWRHASRIKHRASSMLQRNVNTSKSRSQYPVSQCTHTHTHARRLAEAQMPPLASATLPRMYGVESLAASTRSDQRPRQRRPWLLAFASLGDVTNLRKFEKKSRKILQRQVVQCHPSKDSKTQKRESRDVWSVHLLWWSVGRAQC
jgi:hypothetical protein